MYDVTSVEITYVLSRQAFCRWSPSMREITLIGCSAKRISAREKKRKKKQGKPSEPIAVVSMISPIYGCSPHVSY